MEKLKRTIKALSVKKIEQGEIGFLTKEDSKQWFNIRGEKDALEIIVKDVIPKDTVIEFEFNNGVVGNIKVLQKAPEPKAESSMIKIQGKDYMLYTGLLSKAHAKADSFSMEITDSCVSDDMKTAWCKVRLTAIEIGKGEQVFDGFGSSTPDNATAIGSSHPVEMAHTRAKGRALRDYLNIGEVMAEELAKQ